VAAGLTATGAGGTIAVTETNLLLGSDAADLLRGGDGIDTFTGNCGNDTIEGGNDVVADVLTGGLGDDVYVYSGTADYGGAAVVDNITEGLGGGTDTIRFDGAVTTTAAIDANIESYTATAVDGVISITLAAADFTSGLRSVDLSGDTSALGANVINAAAVVAGVSGTGLSLSGSAGVDTITSHGSAGGRATIDGNGGIDVLTAGAGIDTVVLNAGDTGIPNAAALESLTGYTTAVDFIDYGATAITLVAEGVLAPGQATISATGLATFNAADNTTALQLIAVEAAMTAATAVAGEAAVFVSADTPANSILFISDGVAGLTANDVAVEIVGIAAAAGLTVVGGDIATLA
jgi:S-layer protein